MTTTQEELNSYHAAGHALLAALMRRPIPIVGTTRLVMAQFGQLFDAGPYGGPWHCGPFGLTERLRHPVDKRTKQRVREEIAMYVAGYLAEQRVCRRLGGSPCDEGDRDAATDLALDLRGATEEALIDHVARGRRNSRRVPSGMRLVAFVEGRVRDHLARRDAWSAVENLAEEVQRTGQVGPDRARAIILAAFVPAGTPPAERSSALPVLELS